MNIKLVFHDLEGYLKVFAALFVEKDKKQTVHHSFTADQIIDVLFKRLLGNLDSWIIQSLRGRLHESLNQGLFDNHFYWEISYSMGKFSFLNSCFSVNFSNFRRCLETFKQKRKKQLSELHNFEHFFCLFKPHKDSKNLNSWEIFNYLFIMVQKMVAKINLTPSKLQYTSKLCKLYLSFFSAHFKLPSSPRVNLWIFFISFNKPNKFLFYYA